MMISTRGRYALRVMIDLVEQTDGKGDYIPLRDVAKRQGISEKYLESIIASLRQAGYVEGMRVKSGGYRLTKASWEYTVGGILKLTEGTLEAVACQGSACERAGNCKTLPLWQKLDALVDGFLESITLSDLVEGNPLEER